MKFLLPKYSISEARNALATFRVGIKNADIVTHHTKEIDNRKIKRAHYILVK